MSGVDGARCAIVAYRDHRAAGTITEDLIVDMLIDIERWITVARMDSTAIHNQVAAREGGADEETD